MLGLINAVTATFGAIDRYVKQGLVMANRFLTPPKLTFPANASAEFDGASDYIEAPSPFSGNTTDFTISFWMNATADSPIGFGTIGDGSNYAIFYKNSNLLKWEARGTFGIKNLSTTSNPYSGNWEFIALSVDNSTGSIYVNGSKEAEASANAVFSGDLFIGRYGGGLNLDGNLANVAIWNRALSSDEINSVMWKGYNQLATSEKNGLQAWYSLEESELFNASNTSTTNLEQYAQLNNLTFEGKTCLQTALDGLPTITDARLYSAKYDIRVSADGGTIEALNCVETELNALL